MAFEIISSLMTLIIKIVYGEYLPFWLFNFSPRNYIWSQTALYFGKQLCVHVHISKSAFEISVS